MMGGVVVVVEVLLMMEMEMDRKESGDLKPRSPGFGSRSLL